MLHQLNKPSRLKFLLLPSLFTFPYPPPSTSHTTFISLFPTYGFTKTHFAFIPVSFCPLCTLYSSASRIETKPTTTYPYTY